LDIDPNHFPVIRINQVPIGCDSVSDQIIHMVTGQVKAALADVFQGAVCIILALEHHSRDMVKQRVKAGRKLPHSDFCLQDTTSLQK
jgi:hypothetical protein